MLRATMCACGGPKEAEHEADPRVHEHTWRDVQPRASTTSRTMQPWCQSSVTSPPPCH